MAFAKPSDCISGRKPVHTSADVTVCAPRFVQEVTSDDATAVGAIGILPAGCVPALQMIVDAQGADGNVDIGILNAAGDALSDAPEDGGGAWAEGVSLGDPQLVPLTKALLAVQPVGYDRLIAVKGDGLAVAGDAPRFGVTVPYCAR